MRTHLGIYSDWVEAAKKQADLYPAASPGEETRQRIRKILGFSSSNPAAEDVRIETSWKRDGLAGEEISWSVGHFMDPTIKDAGDAFLWPEKMNEHFFPGEGGFVFDNHGLILLLCPVQ